MFVKHFDDGEKIQLFQEDCVKGLNRLDASSVEVIVTSPPYNIGLQYGTYNDSSPREEYLSWTVEWAKAVLNVLSDDGSLFLNVGGKPSDPWVPFEVASCFRAEGFQLQNTFHWIKSIAIEEKSNGENGEKPSFISRGHYKPINSPRYVNDCHEYIFHFTKTGAVELDRLAIGVPYQDKSNISRWASSKSDLRCRGNTWFIPYDTITNRALDRPHPATFPSRLPEMCILLHGKNKVNCVLDPFMGIGSTAIAAVRLGVSAIGYEIDRQYFTTACERIEESVESKTSVPSNTPNQIPLEL